MQQEFDNYEDYIVAFIAKAQRFIYTLLIKEKSWVKSTEGMKKVYEKSFLID